MSSSLMTAVVELRPDFKKFEREAVKGTEQAAKKAGDKLEKGMGDAAGKAGKKAGDEAGRGIERGVGDGAKKAGDRMERELDKAAKASADAANNRWSKVASVGNKMTLGVTLPLVAGMNMAINAAGSLNETLGASEQLFGSSYAGMKEWADGALDSMGLATSTVLAAANQMGGMFKGMGATEDQAAGMTKQLIERARDMAMFYDTSTEEMLTAFRSGMSGEMEPLKRFGVILSATAVEAEAVSSGLVKAQVDTAKLGQAQIKVEKASQKAADTLKTYGEESIEYRDAAADLVSAEASLATVMEGKVGSIDQATLAQARLQLIMKQSEVTNGQYKREEESLAATSERTRENFKKMQEEIGNELLPIKVKLLETVGKLIDVYRGLPEPMKQGLIYLAMFVAAAGPMLRLVAAVRQIAVAHNIAAIAAGRHAAAANAAAVANQRAAMSGMGGRLGGAGRLAAGAGGGLLLANGLLGIHDENGIGWGDAAQTVGGGALIGASIGGAPGALLGGALGAGYSLGSWLVQSGLIPGLAEGGTVERAGLSWVGEQGPELLSLPRGAQVTPLPAMSGNTTIHMNVNVNGGQFDERTLVAHLDQLSRRAAATNTRTRRSVR